MTQHQIILNLLGKYNRWFRSDELILKDTSWGWLGSSGDRRARELAEIGKIERDKFGKYAYYKQKEEN